MKTYNEQHRQKGEKMEIRQNLENILANVIAGGIVALSPHYAPTAFRYFRESGQRNGVDEPIRSLNAAQAILLTSMFNVVAYGIAYESFPESRFFPLMTNIISVTYEIKKYKSQKKSKISGGI